MILPSLLIAQINNGNFEDNGQPSLSGWSFTCPGNITVQDSPFDTAGYCLRLEAGNYQGCFPGFAYQILHDVKNGEVWQIEGWVKTGTPYPYSGIYFAVLKSPGVFLMGKGTFSISSEWKHISVQDTIQIAAHDTLVLVLSAGNISGPARGWTYFDLITATKVIATEVHSESVLENSPTRFTLHQNYPNPFNPATTIKFETPTKAVVSLKVYDILGRELETLFTGETGAGEHSVQWNAERYPSGIYIYTLTSNILTDRKRMLFLK